MATLPITSNSLRTCPYDPAHKVKDSRMQLHVSKCRLNHLNTPKESCPFNAQHLHSKGELEHHLLECPDRSVLDRRLVAASENCSSYRGHTGVPSYNCLPVDTEEHWDTDMASQPVPRYEPNPEPKNGGIRTDFGMMKPAERRQYYESLHAGNPGDDDWEETSEMGDLPKLRNPKSTSHVLEPEKDNVHELRNVGLGRGQPTGSASSRIAANIYGQQQTVPIRQPRSTPNIPGFPPTNVGMGRGGRRAVDEVALDFNKVGFGRGANKD